MSYDKDITINIKFPCCNAPNEYLYDHNDKQTQFQCKVCSTTFSMNPNKDKDIILKCHHCEYQLSNTIAAFSTLSKYNGEFSKDLNVISDGNPIYNIAVKYCSQHNMSFKLYQVIVLKNQDNISKEYRSQKQIIERHNSALEWKTPLELPELKVITFMSNK